MNLFFRQPELIDRHRTRSDYADGAELGIRRAGDGLIAALSALLLVSVLALASLAASGTSFVPLLTIFVAFAALVGVSSLLRSD
jgi:hypothetical protein